MKFSLAFMVAGLLFPTFVLSASGETLLCATERKYGSTGEISSADLERFRPHNRLFVSDGKLIVQRCSFAPSVQMVTCDSYEVDRMETAPVVGIKKYYYFRGQFDLQIYADGSFVENNGRGLISFGHCTEE